MKFTEEATEKFYFRKIYITRISGPYGPLILAPAEGCFGGPSARHLGLWPNNLFQYKHLKNQGYKQGYEQGYAQWVTHDILYVLVRPQGSYPENFVALSSFLAKI